MKKTLSLILSLVIVATSVFCFSSTVFADETFELSPGITATYTTAEKKLTISGVGEIDDYSLSPFVQKTYNSEIENVVIEDGITRLGNNLFAGIINITTVELPDTLESIGSRVFQGCPRIKTLSIPASVTNIDPTGVRTASESLPTQTASILVDENNENYCSVDGVLYDNDMTTLICVPSSWAGERLVIPDTVTTFVDLAGVNCRFLKEIVFPRSIKTVASKTFKNCASLELVTILNQDVELHEQSQLFDGDDNLVLAGYGNSTAKEFAQAIGVPFITLDCEEHTVVPDKGYAPTCTKDGLTDGSHCSVCDKVFVKQEPINKTGHSYKSTSKLTPATEKADGKVVTTYTCKDCGYSYSKTTRVYYSIASIKLNYSVLTYNAQTRNVGVTIKDRKGNTLKKDRDYTVSWESGRKYVGRYACKITFKGNFSGTKTLYLTIKPQATSLTKLTPASKGFKISWKKQATQTSGYQIQYATNKDFTQNAKGIFASGANTTSKSIGKLYGNKGYYVRIRTYKTIKFNGRNVNLYSTWAKPTYVKTK